MAKSSSARKFALASAGPLLAGVAALATIALLTLGSAGVRHGGAREGLFDLYQRLAPMASSPVQRFHIVEIEAESIAQIGPWPWPRSELARVVAGAEAAGARGVVIVDPVDAPDPLSPATIGAFWLEGARDQRLAEELGRLPDTDAALGAALGKMRAAVSIDPGLAGGRSERPDFVATDPDAADWASFEIPTDAGPEALPAGARIALLGATARGTIAEPIASRARIAVAGAPVDEDGVYRAPTLLWSLGGAPAPSISLAAALLASGGEAAVIGVDPTATSPFGRQVASVALGSKGKPMAVDARGRASVAWPKRIETPKTPAWRLLDAAGGSNAQLSGKVALIGLGGDLAGVIRTPLGELSPVEVHAIVADRLVAGAIAARPGWIGYVEAALVMIAGAAAMMWSQRLTFWWSMGTSAAVASMIVAGSATAYGAAATLFDPMPGVIGAFLGAIVVAGGRSLAETFSDEKVRGNFRGALPERTMRALREEGAREVLEGAHREITVIACEVSFMEQDIERFANRPGEMTTVIAEACQALRKSIVELGGAADQGDGGKVFGYFNAPLETADHPRTACTVAIRLVEAMDGINKSVGGSRDIQLRLAIGVAIGVCLVGPMGQGRSNRYSAIGEPLEQAQRLRSKAAVYGPAIICDELVHRRTHHHFAYLELDRDAGEEGRRGASFYALVGNPFVKSGRAFRALEGAHRDMLAAYRAGDGQAARLSLLRARRSPGSNIAVYDIYERRIGDLERESHAETAHDAEAVASPAQAGRGTGADPQADEAFSDRQSDDHEPATSRETVRD